MYVSMCTVYLVGKNATYVGTLELPGTGERKSHVNTLLRVAAEVDVFLQRHADPGKYECAVYFEQMDASACGLATVPWWKLMVSLNKDLSMVWRQEVTRDMLEGKVPNG